MSQETGRKHLITTQLIQTWYMKHVFKDLRGGWRCISFARTKTKKSLQSQKEMARSVNLQRASARAVASRNHSPGGSGKDRWRFKYFRALYSDSQSKSRTKATFRKLKALVRSNGFDYGDAVSSPSFAELIPSADLDFDNIPIDTTDSDLETTGAHPSPRSTDSFLSSCNYDSSAGTASTIPKSPFRLLKKYRIKRSVVRAAKLAFTDHGNGRRVTQRPVPPAACEARSSFTRSVDTMSEKRESANRTLPTTDNLSRGTSMTMDTSSSPCKSTSPSWIENQVENLDDLAETMSISSGNASFQAGGSPQYTERGKDCPIGRDEQNRIHYLRRMESCDLQARPSSSENLQRRKECIMNGVLHTLSGRDFQGAIVDIILQNDVHDLVDLEEFLHGYFRLNTLYQEIIQQFFNDLSSNRVHAEVSRAPSVFARLASANRKYNVMAKAQCNDNSK